MQTCQCQQIEVGQSVSIIPCGHGKINNLIIAKVIKAIGEGPFLVAKIDNEGTPEVTIVTSDEDQYSYPLAWFKIA